MRLVSKVAAGLIVLNAVVFFAAGSLPRPIGSNVQWVVATMMATMLLYFLWMERDLYSPKTNRGEAE